MKDISGRIEIFRRGSFELPFFIGDKVIIKAIKTNGFISAVLFDNIYTITPKYLVDYWIDGFKQQIYLNENEIEKI